MKVVALTWVDRIADVMVCELFSSVASLQDLHFCCLSCLARQHMLYEDAYNLEVVFRKGVGQEATIVVYPLEVVPGKQHLCWQNMAGEFVGALCLPPWLFARGLQRGQGSLASNWRIDQHCACCYREYEKLHPWKGCWTEEVPGGDLTHPG